MGQVISQLGENLNKVAMLWFVYRFSHNAADLAWVGILQTLPPLLFGWFTGPILDRVSRKNVMIFIDITRALLLLLIPLLYHRGLLTLPILFTLVFLISVVSGIFGPALYASIPELVHR
ncbi:Tetracycline resistance determinant tetV, partial [mine drainage metagenome]